MPRQSNRWHFLSSLLSSLHAVLTAAGLLRCFLDALPGAASARRREGIPRNKKEKRERRHGPFGLCQSKNLGYARSPCRSARSIEDSSRAIEERDRSPRSRCVAGR